MSLIKFANINTDYLKWAGLATALQNVPTAAWTMLFGIRHNTVDTANWDAYMYLLSGVGNGVALTGLSKMNGNDVKMDTTGGPSWTTLDPAANQDTLYVLSKATGASTPALSKKVGAGGAWSHANGSSTYANQAAAAQMQVGVYQGTDDPMDGWEGVLAIWNVALTQAQRIACGANWKTSDIYAAHPTPPLLLLELNTNKDNLSNIGTAAISSPAHSGTTLDTGQTFGGWNFDGYGAQFMSVM